MSALSPVLAGAPPRESRFSAADFAIVGGVLAFAAVLALLCSVMPARLPAWAPYDFSWSEFLALAFTAACYLRGVRRMSVAERPSRWRHLGFALGLGLIYAVLQTHFDYMAQHMFFISRLQHLAMHHLGPFLIALAWPGAALFRGLPVPLRRTLHAVTVQRVLYWVQQPFIAGLLFVGLLDLWLLPAVNFRAMIDPRLYTLMNWTMVVDGVLFWCVILDPRGSPPARASFAIRLLTAVLVMFPQILVGSYLTFSTTDLYPFYDLCGRLYPSISAIADQHLGGLLVWIPASMMSGVAFMLTMNHLRVREEARPLSEMTEQERRMAEMARAWTGR